MKFAVHTDIQSFLKNKCSLYCYKPLTNFQILEKLILSNYASVLIAFMEDKISGSFILILKMFLHGSFSRKMVFIDHNMVLEMLITIALCSFILSTPSPCLELKYKN